MANKSVLVPTIGRASSFQEVTGAVNFALDANRFDVNRPCLVRFYVQHGSGDTVALTVKTVMPGLTNTVSQFQTITGVLGGFTSDEAQAIELQFEAGVIEQSIDLLSLGSNFKRVVATFEALKGY